MTRYDEAQFKIPKSPRTSRTAKRLFKILQNKFRKLYKREAINFDVFRNCKSGDSNKYIKIFHKRKQDCLKAPPSTTRKEPIKEKLFSKSISE